MDRCVVSKLGSGLPELRGEWELPIHTPRELVSPLPSSRVSSKPESSRSEPISGLSSLTGGGFK